MKISSRSKLLVLLIYLLALAVLLTGYHLRRIAGIQKNSAELKAIQAEISAVNKTTAEIDLYRKMYSTSTQTMAYVESLYRMADENRLKFIEVTSDNTPVPAGNDTISPASRLKVTVKGDFRSTAEFVRCILNRQQFSRITELKVTADGNGVMGNIHIELFSIK